MNREVIAELEKADDPLKRKSLYELAYNPLHTTPAAEPVTVHSPTKRRQRRLRLYTQIMGDVDGDVLEIGCGTGDCACVLARQASRVVAIDISTGMLKQAQLRARRYPELASKLEFRRMNAVEMEFADESFEFALSTSLIEHLHPEDVDIHLREAWRVLKPGGRYAVWCPNRLGHHGDRAFHLCMMSHHDLRGRMIKAGFRSFHSPMFRGWPMIATTFKIGLENAMAGMRVPILWSHLGVRNVMIVACK